MIHIKVFPFNPFSQNTLVVSDKNKNAVIVDPGCINAEEVEILCNYINQNNLNIKSIWLTHAHFDHIYGVSILQNKYKVDVLMSKEDEIIIENNAIFAKTFGMPAPDISFSRKYIKQDDEIVCGDLKFCVIETPGHTPGGLCFYCQSEKVLISGDTLFAGSIGRTDSPWGDYDKLIVSIMDKLMGLDGDVTIIPGHGGKSDIGYERTHNPFLEPFNEPIEDTEWDKDLR